VSLSIDHINQLLSELDASFLAQRQMLTTIQRLLGKPSASTGNAAVNAELISAVIRKESRPLHPAEIIRLFASRFGVSLTHDDVSNAYDYLSDSSVH